MCRKLHCRRMEVLQLLGPHHEGEWPRQPEERPPQSNLQGLLPLARAEHVAHLPVVDDRCQRGGLLPLCVDEGPHLQQGLERQVAAGVNDEHAPFAPRAYRQTPRHFFVPTRCHRPLECRASLGFDLCTRSRTGLGLQSISTPRRIFT